MGFGYRVCTVYDDVIIAAFVVEPFRTLEDLTIVPKRMSAFLVHEEGNLKEANIYFNDNNAAFPLDDKEKQLIKDPSHQQSI